MTEPILPRADLVGLALVAAAKQAEAALSLVGFDDFPGKPDATEALSRLATLTHYARARNGDLEQEQEVRTSPEPERAPAIDLALDRRTPHLMRGDHVLDKTTMSPVRFTVLHTFPDRGEVIYQIGSIRVGLSDQVGPNRRRDELILIERAPSRIGASTPADPIPTRDVAIEPASESDTVGSPAFGGGPKPA
jgi:hypothetical protein